MENASLELAGWLSVCLCGFSLDDPKYSVSGLWLLLVLNGPQVCVTGVC